MRIVFARRNVKTRQRYENTTANRTEKKNQQQQQKIMLINVDIIGLSRLDSLASKAERRKSFLLFTINSDNNDTIFHAIAYSA